MKKRILSGMRPTGRLHLGHLVGVLNNWVSLQGNYDCFFMIADWHALMSEYENPSNLRGYVYDCLADWLAVGINPKDSTIFVQSDVDEHLELSTVLGIITPLSWLERCPTYKEQLRELSTRDLTTFGFLGYPVLQAADILLYKAHCVPIGADQIPHLEIAREIVRRFVNLYKKEIFPEPEAILTKMPKFLGIDNRKMSKSYDNYIALSDEPNLIREKVMKMITDPARIKLNDLGHPDICNVYTYYSIFMPEKKQEVYDWCSNAKLGCTKCKEYMAGALIKYLSPITEKRNKLIKDRPALDGILLEGRKKAKAVAEKTMHEVKVALNLI